MQALECRKVEDISKCIQKGLQVAVTDGARKALVRQVPAYIICFPS
jgi:hypothetical protein